MKIQKVGKIFYHRLRIFPMPNCMKTIMGLSEHIYTISLKRTPIVTNY